MQGYESGTDNRLFPGISGNFPGIKMMKKTGVVCRLYNKGFILIYFKM